MTLTERTFPQQGTRNAKAPLETAVPPSEEVKQDGTLWPELMAEVRSKFLWLMTCSEHTE